MKPLLQAGVLGGVVLFLWGAFSWMVLPWHDVTISNFTNEDQVMAAIRANAPISGIYSYPGEGTFHEDMSAEQRAQAQEQAWEKMRRGPYAFVAYADHGMPSMVLPLLMSLVIQVAGALVVSWLLIQAALPGFAARVGFVVWFMLGVGIFGHLPYWNWWSFSTPFILVQVVDLLVGGVLAGLVIARYTRAGAR